MGVQTPHILDGQTCPLQFPVEETYQKGTRVIRYRDRTRSTIFWAGDWRTFKLAFRGSKSQMASLVAFLNANWYAHFYFDNKMTSETDIKVAPLNAEEGFTPIYEKPEEAHLEIEVEQVP